MPIIFVFALNVFNTASIIGNRVMLALFALHLGATPITVGLLGAMFAMFPTLLAVTAGRLCDRYGFSWWDAQIVAAARRADCAILLSEDMQHGLELDGLRIVNPFLADSGGNA